MNSIQREATGNQRTARHTEATIVSYPKSGRTWLRYLLGVALTEHFRLKHPDIEKLKVELEPLSKLHPEVPKFSVIHDDHPEWKKPHELSADKSEFMGKVNILMVRDPRDVIVSLYFEHKERIDMYSHYLARCPDLQQYLHRVKPFDGSIHEFVAQDVGGIDTIITYYNIWAEAQGEIDYFLVRYEDLMKRTADIMKDIFNYLNIRDVSFEAIAKAVKDGSFQSMRDHEVSNHVDSFILTPKNHSDFETYKTRRGLVGGYVDYLDDHEIEMINTKIAERLNPAYMYSD
jgi:hypothetical protein